MHCSGVQTDHTTSANITNFLFASPRPRAPLESKTYECCSAVERELFRFLAPIPESLHKTVALKSHRGSSLELPSMEISIPTGPAPSPASPGGSRPKVGSTALALGGPVLSPGNHPLAPVLSQIFLSLASWQEQPPSSAQHSQTGHRGRAQPLTANHPPHGPARLHPPCELACELSTSPLCRAEPQRARFERRCRSLSAHTCSHALHTHTCTVTRHTHNHPPDHQRSTTK